MTTFRKAIKEVINARFRRNNTLCGDTSRLSYFIRRSEWEENLVVMIPAVSNQPMRMMCTKTFHDVDYIPSVQDMLSKDWIIIPWIGKKLTETNEEKQ